MGWRILLQPDVQKFITDHEQDDVKNLALKKPPDASWPYGLILDQIKVRQKAKTKSLNLYETNGFIFPKNDVFEQSSSIACASYKGGLAAGKTFVDLTAGSGADSFCFSQNFETGHLIEREPYTAELLTYNVGCIQKSGQSKCDMYVHIKDCNSYLQNSEKVDFIYADPARRSDTRKGVYDLKECSPDIISILDVLKNKTDKMMVKTSPVLDIEKAIASLEAVTQVHVVQWREECKEVLYLLDFTVPKLPLDEVEIIAVAINDAGQVQQKFTYKIGDEKNLTTKYSMPQKYIYEPGPAFQKSGGYESMAEIFDVGKLHRHTHLYTSDRKVENFPGKRYEVEEVVSVHAKNISIKKADIRVRNFPEKVDKLKRKLKISDGGVHRIYASTLANEEKKLIVCKK